MTSEQCAELIGSHADGGKYAAQGALEQILVAMNGHGHGAAVGMAHDVMAAVDSSDGEADTLQRLDYLRSRYGRDSTGHKPARYYKSGHVECQSEFVRYPDLFDQELKAGAQVGDRGFLCFALSERGDARAELGGCTPAAAVLVLLDDIGHVNDTSHISEYDTDLHSPCASHRLCKLFGTSRDVLGYSGRKEHVNPGRSDAR